MNQKQKKKTKLQKKFDEVYQKYQNENDVCFDEFKDTIRFGNYTMGEIIELYGALCNAIDGDVVEKVSWTTDSEGWCVIPEHNCIGETILERSLTKDLEELDRDLKDLRKENEELRNEYTKASKIITECKKVLGINNNQIATPF